MVEGFLTFCPVHLLHPRTPYQNVRREYPLLLRESCREIRRSTYNNRNIYPIGSACCRYVSFDQPRPGRLNTQRRRRAHRFHAAVLRSNVAADEGAAA